MIVAIIVDSPVGFLPGNGRSSRVLSIPLGTETVRERLRRLVLRAGCDQFILLGDAESFVDEQESRCNHKKNMGSGRKLLFTPYPSVFSAHAFVLLGFEPCLILPDRGSAATLT